MFELRDLLTLPRLGLQLRAYPEGRDTPIRWARIVEDVLDLEACTGGELMLTRGRWRRAPADADRLVCDMAQRGVGALAVKPSGAAMLDELVAACERWRVPLLSVAGDVSVEEVAETAITMSLHRRNAASLRLQERHRELIDLIGPEPEDIRRVLTLMAGDLACGTWLLLGATVLAADGCDELSDEDLAAVTAAVEGRRGTIELVAQGGAPMTAMPLGSPAGPPVAHLLTEMPSLDLTPDDRASVGQLGQVLRRQLRLMRRARALRRRVGAEFVRRAVSGEAQGVELDAWARGLEVSTDGHVVCLVAQLPEAAPEDVEHVADAVDEMAEFNAIAHVVVTDDHEVTALLFPGAPPERVDEAVRRAILALGASISRQGGAIGHSSVIAKGPEDVSRMVHEARRVCQLNSLSEPVEPAAEHPPRAPLSALLLMGNDDAMRSLHELMLAPLIDYDAAHGSELVHTLDVFLSNDGQWSASAAALGVHVNTLRYRIARIEKCTGRDPSAMADRVDFYVALRACQAGPRHVSSRTA